MPQSILYGDDVWCRRVRKHDDGSLHFSPLWHEKEMSFPHAEADFVSAYPHLSPFTTT